MQGGDSFDIANVLTSLLIGVGYDAYMVMGYATPGAVNCDQTQVSCPFSITATLEGSEGCASKSRGRLDERKKPSKYALRPQTTPTAFTKALQQVSSGGQQIVHGTIWWC